LQYTRLTSLINKVKDTIYCLTMINDKYEEKKKIYVFVYLFVCLFVCLFDAQPSDCHLAVTFYMNLLSTWHTTIVECFGNWG
jgi:hypothetical protein